MKTKTYTVYKYDELPEETQQKVLEDLAYINLDHEWWGCAYEDAKSIGVDITDFYLDRHRSITGAFLDSPLSVIDNILKNHGEKCDTYQTADQYSKQYKELPTDQDGYIMESAFEEWSEQFLNAILEDYLVILEKEYEYLTSEEAIKETIAAHECEFTIDGKLD